MEKLYIFDFDGMLVDTIVDSMTCVNKTLMEFNLPTFDEDLSDFIYEDFRQFLRDNNATKDTPVYPRFIELSKTTSLEHTQVYEGMIDVLKELESKEIVLAVCSNRDEKVLTEFMHKFLEGIDFKYISGFRQGIPDKPNPYRLNEIIEQSGIDKRNVIYFGDKDVDITTAQRAGIDMVLVTYGQGNEIDYKNSYPIKVIDSPKEILDI